MLSTDASEWPWYIQLWLACRERWVAATAIGPGGPRWPPHNLVWEKGTITAVTATSITDGTKTWQNTFSNPWASVDDPNTPGNWSIVIDDCNPMAVVHVNITATPVSGDTVGVEDMTEFVTDRTVLSLASLVGKNYYIIRGIAPGGFGEIDNGIWWHERIPQWPNSWMYDGGDVVSGSATTITAAKGWAVNQWFPGGGVIYDVMYRNTLNVLCRGHISANTADTLTFSGGSGTPAGKFYIVAGEGYFQWKRSPLVSDPMLPGQAFCWYRGPGGVSYYTHLPNDGIGTFTLPALAVPIGGGGGMDIYRAGINRLDRDVIMGFDITPYDTPLAPQICKTIRQVQCFIEDICQYFIDPGPFDMREFKPSPYRPATLFQRAGINAQQGATGIPLIDGMPVGGIEMPWGSPTNLLHDVRYTVYDKPERGGRIITSGTTDWDGSKLLGGGWQDLDPDDPTKFYYAGKRIVLSLGWTRWIPREFKYMFQKSVWIPSANGFGDLQPISDAFPGKYENRGPSDSYVDRTTDGVVTGGGTQNDFVDGEYARYIGDNTPDPCIFAVTLLRADVPDTGIKDSWDRFFVGRHPKATQTILDAQLSGTATEGSTHHLIDAAQDWWTNNWYFGGVNYTEGPNVAGAGSSTTQIVDPTQVGTGLWDDATGRYAGFVVEVELDPGGAPGVWTKRAISSFDKATATLTLMFALPSSALGKNYRIREPAFELNRYQGRSLRIDWPDGDFATTTILYSDDNSLWFGALVRAVEAGCSYTIADPSTGSVWKRVNYGNGWDVPDGNDQFKAVSTMVKRYGLATIGDEPFASLLEEPYKALNVLRSTYHESFNWSGRQNAAVAEINHRQNIESHRTDFDDAENDAVNGYFTNWGPYVGLDPDRNPSEFAEAPIAQYYADNLGGGPNLTAAIRRTTGHAVITLGDGGHCHISSNTDFYVKAATPGIDAYKAAWPDEDTGRCNYNGLAFDPDASPKVRTIFIFDNNGDLVSCNRFRLFTSGGVDFQSGTEGIIERRSGTLGSLTRPNRPPDPQPRPTAGVATFIKYWQGWQAVDTFAITHWDMSYLVAPVDPPGFWAGMLNPGFMMMWGL